MEPIVPIPEFFFPGTFEVEPPYREGDPQNLHQAGMDAIDPAYDAIHPDNLAGAIGFDPADYAPSLDSELTIEKGLPQWGPPFVKFVDHRISELEKKVQKAIEQWSFQTQTFVLETSFNTDGTGNVGAPGSAAPVLVESRPGWTYALHRFIVLQDPATFGTPFTGAGCYWELRMNGVETVDGGSLASGSGSLPFVKTYGTRDALRIRDGELLTFFIFNTSANKRMTVKLQCSVDRTIEG